MFNRFAGLLRQSCLNRFVKVTPIDRRVTRIFPISIRSYSAGPALTKENITERILEILEDYDNVKNVDRISPTADFSADLGLDSLDQVEVLMEIENEFSIIIPDEDADNLKGVDQAVNYILSQPDAC